MIMKIKSDKIIVENKIVQGIIVVKGKQIAEILENDDSDADYNFTGKYVSPGFIDMHTHGAGGYSFASGDSQEIVGGCNFHLQHGTTTILPTVSADYMYNMKAAVQAVHAARKDKDLKANLPGVHLEGPYLSKEQSGAQGNEFIKNPDCTEYKTLLKEYGKDVARWTYAPENDKCQLFCKELIRYNVIPSAGHTNAVFSDMMMAKDCGCRLITHLYSCTSSVTRENGFRRLGVIETAYLDDDIFVEIIADGKHLPKELVKLILKIKGYDKVVVVSDSLAIAGTQIRSGIVNGKEFIVEDGVCKLKNRSAFAGSVATADLLLRFLTHECEVSVPNAVKMMAANPAKLLRLKKGAIVKGYDADIIVFNSECQISDVFVNGEKAI